MWRLLALTAATLLSPASAEAAAPPAPIVLSADPEDPATRRLVRLTLGPARLGATWQTLPELVAPAPEVLVLSGRLQACGYDPWHPDDTHSALVWAIEPAWNDNDAAALRRLSRVRKQLACATAPLEPADAGLVMALEAGLAADLGEDNAVDLYWLALQALPELEDAHSEAALEAQEEAREALASSSSARLARYPPEASLRLDGHALPTGVVSVPEGRHLFQQPDSPTAVGWLDVQAGLRAVVLLRDQVGPEDLDWAAHPQSGDDLLLLLRQLTQPRQPVHIVSEGVVWSAVVGKPGWTGRAAPQIDPTWPRVATGVGASATLGGLVLYLSGYTRASQAAEDALFTDTFAEYRALEDQYSRSVSRARAGKVLALTGIAITGTGAFLFPRSRVRLVVQVPPGTTP